MTDAATARLADKYIGRDGEIRRKPTHSLTVGQEKIALEALRQIARGNADGTPLKGNKARDVARRALIDVMQPNFHTAEAET